MNQESAISNPQAQLEFHFILSGICVTPHSCRFTLKVQLCEEIVHFVTEEMYGKRGLFCTLAI